VLDVVLRPQPIDNIQNLMGVTFPVGRGCHGKIVGASDFVEVNKIMSSLDNLYTGFCGQGWFKANPRKNASRMKLLKSCNSIHREGRPTFPLHRKGVIQACQGTGKGISLRTKQIHKRDCAVSALREGAEGETVVSENFDCWAGQGRIEWVKWVSRERQHDLFCNSRLEVLPGVFSERFEEVRARGCGGVKLCAVHFQNLRHVTIRALVSAASIWVRCKLGILSGLPARGVDVRATLDRPSIVFGLHNGRASPKPAVRAGGFLLGWASGLTASASKRLGGGEHIDLFCDHLRILS